MIFPRLSTRAPGNARRVIPLRRYPASQAEWLAAFGASSMATPNYIYTFQEASGNIIEKVAGAFNGQIANGTLYTWRTAGPADASPSRFAITTASTSARVSIGSPVLHIGSGAGNKVGSCFAQFKMTAPPAAEHKLMGSKGADGGWQLMIQTDGVLRLDFWASITLVRTITVAGGNHCDDTWYDLAVFWDRYSAAEIAGVVSSKAATPALQTVSLTGLGSIDTTSGFDLGATISTVSGLGLSWTYFAVWDQNVAATNLTRLMTLTDFNRFRRPV